MNALKQSQYELLPLNPEDVPIDVIALAESYGPITEMKRFRARNHRKLIQSGFIFATSMGRTVVAQEGCELLDNNRMIPAWGITLVSPIGPNPLDEAVDGLFCHTAVKIGFYGYNVAVKDVLCPT